MAAPRPQPSAPFLSREFNGAVLLEELDELRAAQVPGHHLADVVNGLRNLGGVRVSEAVARLKQLAQGRFSGQPAVASLLVRWASRLKSEPDVPLLVGHLERLATASALVGALRRGSARLNGGKG